jgi:hypothetical protein
LINHSPSAFCGKSIEDETNPYDNGAFLNIQYVLLSPQFRLSKVSRSTNRHSEGGMAVKQALPQ